MFEIKIVPYFTISYEHLYFIHDEIFRTDRCFKVVMTFVHLRS